MDHHIAIEVDNIQDSIDWYQENTKCEISHKMKHGLY